MDDRAQAVRWFVRELEERGFVRVRGGADVVLRHHGLHRTVVVGTDGQSRSVENTRARLNRVLASMGLPKIENRRGRARKASRAAGAALLRG